MTIAQVKDYINTYIKTNGRKEIGGDHVNYAMNAIVDQLGNISDSHIGNSDLTLSDVSRKLIMSGGGSGYKFSIRDYLDTKDLFKVDGTGKTTMEAATVSQSLYSSLAYIGLNGVAAQNALNVYSRLASSSGIARFYNISNIPVVQVRQAAGSGLLYVTNSSGATQITLNGSSGRIDSLNGFSKGGVNGFTGSGPFTNFTISGGIITNAT